MTDRQKPTFNKLTFITILLFAILCLLAFLCVQSFNSKQSIAKMFSNDMPTLCILEKDNARK